MNRPAFSVRSAHQFLPLWLCVLMALAAAGCGRDEPNDPPVATPSFAIERNRVAIGSPVELKYRFDVAPAANIDGDYWVFVHVLDPGGEQLWTDDHEPAVPTSQWKPGQTVEYARKVFVPNYPYIGEAVVRLGLYSQESGRRLALSAQETSRREYVVGRFQILPQSENIFLIDKAGWHPVEVAPDNPSSEWKWTRDRAVVSFRNPKRDATFYLQYDARVDQFNPPQQVTIRLGDEVIGSFTADAEDPTLLTFPIAAAQLGAREMAEISIHVDKTFKPTAGDTRDLGIRVFHTFLEAKQ